MKVVHYINESDKRHGGAQVLLRQLNRELLDLGVDSSVVSVLSTEEAFEGGSSLDCDAVYGWKGLKRIARNLRQLDKEVIVHGHLFPTILYLAILKQIGWFRNPLVFTEHSTSNRRRSKWYGKWIDRLIYSNIDHIVAISQGAANELVQWQRRTSNKISVIQNGIDLSRKEWTEPQKGDTTIVLSMGRLTEAKNYPHMIKAFKYLKDEKVQYRIAGSGELHEHLVQLIETEQLSDTVQLLGYQSEVSEVLEKADIFLMASKWEGFGIAAIEAMNYGLPLVASNVPGLREVVGEDERSALLVDPLNSKDIADKIRLLINDLELRKQMGKSGFDRSLYFGSEGMAKGYVKQYVSILS